MITIKIPERAAQLIVQGGRNTNDVCLKFMEDERAETMKLKTFGMYITDIVRTWYDDTKSVVGHVVYWENGIVTCSITCGDNSELIGCVDFSENKRHPMRDECLTMWETFYND